MRCTRVLSAIRSSKLLIPLIVATLLGTALVAATVSNRHQEKVPDVDGDGLPDPTIWRPPSSGLVTEPTFYTMTSSSGYSPVATLSYPLGNEGDIPVMADFDGDGKTDFAVYRPTLVYAWFVRLSSQNYTAISTYQWGVDQDVPVPGDYDGDGKTDIAVFRAWDGGWYILQGATNFTSAFLVRWGNRGSTPVPGDYDGDGKLDIATFDPNAEGDGVAGWYILQGGSRFTSAFSVKLGGANAEPAQADYDGDGKTDVAVYDSATSTFSILYAAGGFKNGLSRQWGVPGDTPVPADYDGDGKADIAVYRPSSGTYYILQASSNFTTGLTRTMSVGGTAADVPALAR